MFADPVSGQTHATSVRGLRRTVADGRLLVPVAAFSAQKRLFSCAELSKEFAK